MPESRSSCFNKETFDHCIQVTDVTLSASAQAHRQGQLAASLLHAHEELMAPEEASHVVIIVAWDLERLTGQCIVVSIHCVYNKLSSCGGEGFVSDEINEP